ncbi:BnaA09g10570D [Brassica napus]|uniref:BnaA09g10570D protein n=1 Tax=Brassica napus TaxID=3708 RepID=A0A078HMP6_BRANA|nr:BnaA09g10570D [Brassica napus]
MASSDALLPVIFQRKPLSDSRSDDLILESRRRQPIKVHRAVILLLVALYVTLIVIHNESASKNGGSNETTTKSPAQLAGVSEKRNFRKTEPFAWKNTMLSWQRTAFHFQPEKNWMNGPLFYKGLYHFVYQYNINGAVWGDIAWGHAVAKDLIHWFHLPLAMVPDQWYDANGVWTGSATLLDDGSIVMLYTGSTDNFVQVQNLAYPEDPSDPLLLKWTKFSGNPVLVPPPGIGAKDFRDPTTAWKTLDGKWRITIGSKVNRTGISLVYDTTDFKTYEKLDNLLHQVPDTGMIDHYAIGTYYDSNGTWISDDPTFDVGKSTSLRYDYGKFYSSKTFYDQNKRRRILWGWIGESDSEAADVQKGWSSVQQSIPRTVVLDTKTGKNLVQWPVEEVKSLRLSSKKFDMKVKPETVVQVDVSSTAQLDIEAEFEINKEDLKKITGDESVEAEEDFSCETSGGSTVSGALGPFGFSVLTDESLSEQTTVYFYVTKGKDSKLKTFFCTDTLRSTMANDVVKSVYGSFVPVLKEEKLTMRILVDHSIIEGFGQGGRTCITSRVYPTEATYGAAKLFLFNNAFNATITASFEVWQMNSAFIRPYSAADLVLLHNSS